MRRTPATGPTSTHWLPYALAGAGLLVGLMVILFEPLPWSAANVAVGWSALVVALGSGYVLVARHGEPGERGPDF